MKCLHLRWLWRRCLSAARISCWLRLFVIFIDTFVDIPFDVFIGVFLIAQVLGVFSQVPGGLGVFEGLFMFIIPGEHNQAMLFGALIAYRIIYYLLPLVFSAIMLIVYELAPKQVKKIAGKVSEKVS